METRGIYFSEDSIKNINQFLSIYVNEFEKSSIIDCAKKKEILDSVNRLADFLDLHRSLTDKCFSLTLEEL